MLRLLSHSRRTLLLIDMTSYRDIHVSPKSSSEQATSSEKALEWANAYLSEACFVCAAGPIMAKWALGPTAWER